MRVPARRSFNGHLVLPSSVDARMTTRLTGGRIDKKHREIRDNGPTPLLLRNMVGRHAALFVLRSDSGFDPGCLKGHSVVIR